MVKAQENIKVREDEPTNRFPLPDVSKRRDFVDVACTVERTAGGLGGFSADIKYNRLAKVPLRGLYKSTDMLTLLEVTLLLVSDNRRDITNVSPHHYLNNHSTNTI